MKRTKLNDNDIMSFGKYKGTRLGIIPDHYWLWFIKQDWAINYADLYEYAQMVEESQDHDTNEDQFEIY